jgi:hypothetical protein
MTSVASVACGTVANKPHTVEMCFTEQFRDRVNKLSDEFEAILTDDGVRFEKFLSLRTKDHAVVLTYAFEEQYHPHKYGQKLLDINKKFT